MTGVNNTRKRNHRLSIRHTRQLARIDLFGIARHRSIDLQNSALLIRVTVKILRDSGQRIAALHPVPARFTRSIRRHPNRIGEVGDTRNIATTKNNFSRVALFGADRATVTLAPGSSATTVRPATGSFCNRKSTSVACPSARSLAWTSELAGPTCCASRCCRTGPACNNFSPASLIKKSGS